nr:putative nuclease HARBI1 [Rhipicephalus microplus]
MTRRRLRRKRVVDFPLTTAAKDEAKAEFARRGCIPGVLACVDGTLVAIRKPEGYSLADTASFMSRKGYYALNVMIVCNARLRILVVDPRFPGSCHDSWVWEHNPLRSRLAAQLQPGEYLLGDAGYPLEPWLLVPVPGSHPGNTFRRPIQQGAQGPQPRPAPVLRPPAPVLRPPVPVLLPYAAPEKLSAKLTF